MRSPPPAAAARARAPRHALQFYTTFGQKFPLTPPSQKGTMSPSELQRNWTRARAARRAMQPPPRPSTMCKEGRKKERAWPRLRRTPRYAVCFLHRRRCRRRNCCCCRCGASPKVKAARLTGEGRGPLRRRRRPCSTPPAPLLLRHATRGALGKGEGGGEREGEGEGTMKLPNQTMPDKLARKLNFPRN